MYILYTNYYIEGYTVHGALHSRLYDNKSIPLGCVHGSTIHVNTKTRIITNFVNISPDSTINSKYRRSFKL